MAITITIPGLTKIPPLPRPIKKPLVRVGLVYKYFPTSALPKGHYFAIEQITRIHSDGTSFDVKVLASNINESDWYRHGVGGSCLGKSFQRMLETSTAVILTAGNNGFIKALAKWRSLQKI